MFDMDRGNLTMGSNTIYAFPFDCQIVYKSYYFELPELNTILWGESSEPNK